MEDKDNERKEQLIYETEQVTRILSNSEMSDSDKSFVKMYISKKLYLQTLQMVDLKERDSRALIIELGMSMGKLYPNESQKVLIAMLQKSENIIQTDLISNKKTPFGEIPKENNINIDQYLPIIYNYIIFGKLTDLNSVRCVSAFFSYMTPNEFQNSIIYEALCNVSNDQDMQLDEDNFYRCILAYTNFLKKNDIKIDFDNDQLLKNIDLDIIIQYATMENLYKSQDLIADYLKRLFDSSEPPDIWNNRTLSNIIQTGLDYEIIKQELAKGLPTTEIDVNRLNEFINPENSSQPLSEEKLDEFLEIVQNLKFCFVKDKARKSNEFRNKNIIIKIERKWNRKENINFFAKTGSITRFCYEERSRKISRSNRKDCRRF